MINTLRLLLAAAVTALALFGAGLPAVSFVDVTSGVVKLARRSAVGSWTVETVAGTSMTPARW